MVIRNLVCDFTLGIICPNQLIRNLDLISTTLLDQFVVLGISYHSFFALFEALPLLVLNHGCISIHVLPLQLNFLEFFRKTSVFICLVMLFGRNFWIGLFQAFLASRQPYLLQFLAVLSFALLCCLSWLLTALACLLNSLGVLHQVLGVTFLLRKVAITLELKFLLELFFIQLKAFTQLCHWHLDHQAMFASLGRVETLAPLDWYFLKLSDLPD